MSLLSLSAHLVLYICMCHWYCEWMCMCVYCAVIVMSSDFYVFYLISWHSWVELGILICCITSPLSLSLKDSVSLCFPSLSPPTRLYISITQSYSLSSSFCFLSVSIEYSVIISTFFTHWEISLSTITIANRLKEASSTHIILQSTSHAVVFESRRLFLLHLYTWDLSLSPSIKI